MKKTVGLASAVLSLSLVVGSFSGTASAMGETTTPAPAVLGEKSLDSIINDIGTKVNVTDETVAIENKSDVLEKISQEDVDNLNALAKSQGIQYEEPLTKESLVNMFEAGIDSVNEEVAQGDLEVLEDGSLIDSEDENFYVQGGSTYDKTYWWGKKRYKSTYAANKWVSQLNTAGNLNAGAAVLAGAIFGGVGAIPNGLTSAYSYQLANKVSYRNSLNNRGIIANLTWALVFTTSSQ